MRLQPSLEDGYAWSVLEGKEYLLATNLGNGTVGRCQDIQQSLGSSLEAVAPPGQQPTGADTTSNVEVSACSIFRFDWQGHGTALLTRAAQISERRLHIFYRNDPAIRT